MPRPRIHDDAVRTRLLEAAAQLLVEQGPHALSLRTVAAAAHTSTSAIYSLFGGKEQLLRGLYLEGFGRFAAALHTVAPLAGGDPLERLRLLDEVYFAFALAEPSFYTVMFGPPLPDFAPSDDDRAFALTTLQVLIDAVQDCVDGGHLPGPAEGAAVQLWATEHGVATLAIAGMLGTVDEARAFARATTATMVAGLAARPPAGPLTSPPSTLSPPGGSATRPRPLP